MAHHIKQLLHTLVPQTAEWKRVLLQNWPSIMGKLHTHVTIEQVYEDSLVLGVQDSCWLQELHVLSPVLIKQINEKLDLPRIKQIRFKQVGRVAKKVTQASRTQVHETPQEVQLDMAQQEALRGIADPGLQAALTSYLIRCCQENK